MISPYQQTQKQNEREPRQTTSEPKTRLPQKTKTKDVTGKKGTKNHQQKTWNEHKTGTPHPRVNRIQKTLKQIAKPKKITKVKQFQ